ncbi:phage tail sheath subtilisin-like domain-containing protein [Leeuwenhoekiella palythoae]|uniref:phage tail sheath family protein n=1 Tax=Leeuwenhoekiella palythoae TaxID=573501 RepID=UPI001CE0AD71|nr:phage tail sheath C-terminal domain-containing protein [Leeuwenhoekiella palythoae]UBZ10406.1 phage tail sheath subtilisin-like domain-containing protein [Leeuwenhoekiella palythoae]
MASSYKTPGVYVEEISVFPPSVAQVETAIPAFIGYTNKVSHKTEQDLLLTPKKIGSMLEFVSLYGGAPEANINDIQLTASKSVGSFTIEDTYYLYDALRLFYANGGGDCYIVSVGKCGEDSIALTALENGLAKIAKVDEPTLLVSPDACLLDQADLDSFNQALLKQCGKLGDRFALLGIKNDNEDLEVDISAFRNGVGMNSLKYGAAYTPWLKANLPRTVHYKSLKGKISLGGIPVTLADLIQDADAKSLANQLDELIDDSALITNKLNDLADSSSSVDNQYQELLTTVTTSSSIGNLVSLLQFYADAIDFIRDIVEVGTDNYKLKHTSATAPDQALQTHLNSVFSTSLTSGSIHSITETISDILADFNAEYDPDRTVTSTTGVDYGSGGTGTYFQGGETQTFYIAELLPTVSAFYTEIKSSLDYISSTTANYLSTYETAATEMIPALKSIKNAIAGEYIVLPPNAAIAGVYARTDANRGVWKAPANTSLNSVVGVTHLIDHDDQQGLNVDTVAGKSINAIRPFTGKGIMVWGARTLAGNDNEWRYVPVRRFFNMVEESVKKATEQFVFESNDANTWVKVRAMIENFLNLQWRAGALAGAKPNDAFYVRVGLGETMTAEDILNGIMAIEIGMAVVRPAEFIILKFSHKMQES